MAKYPISVLNVAKTNVLNMGYITGFKCANVGF